MPLDLDWKDSGEAWSNGKKRQSSLPWFGAW